MPLSKLYLQLDEMGECFDGVDFSAPETFASPRRYCRGMCYAFDLQALVREQLAHGTSWHILLLQSSVAGLSAQKSRQRALLAYELLSEHVRLFLLANKESTWAKYYASVSRIPGFIESGIDSVEPTQLRPMLLWEPSQSAIALWPTGANEEITGVRGVDTGLLSTYQSELMDQSQLVDAGLEYLPIPNEEGATFSQAGRAFSYINRFVVLR